MLNIFYGGEVHLWFLPFMFFAIVLGDFVAIWLGRLGLRGSGAMAVLGVCTALVVYMVLDRLPAVIPVSQFKFGTVSAAIGWCFWCFKSLPPGLGVFASCLGSAIVLAAIILFGEPLEEIYPQIIGVAMVSLVLAVHSGPLALSRIGRRYSLFIYLVHVLVWQLLYKFVKLDADVATIVIFSISLALAYLADYFLSFFQGNLRKRLSILLGL